MYLRKLHLATRLLYILDLSSLDLQDHGSQTPPQYAQLTCLVAQLRRHASILVQAQAYIPSEVRYPLRQQIKLSKYKVQ